MRGHAMLGHDMLSGSESSVLQAGAMIALDHHERWDGAGYPSGRSGEDIHIFGRIVAVADVFDALGSRRCYKEAWPLKTIVTTIEAEAGQQFDPKVVQALLKNIDNIAALRTEFPD